MSNDRVIVRIVDRGPGIPPLQLERVFEPFYRAGTRQRRAPRLGPRAGDRARVRQANGGQAVRRVAARSGRDVRVRAAARSESRRAVRRGPAAERLPAASATSRRVASRERRRACWSSTTSCRSCGRCGWCCARRASRWSRRRRPPRRWIARRCVRRRRRSSIWCCPTATAIEVTRRLREWSEMPILVLSAIGEEEQKVRALEAGADDYVTKPFGARELVARLQAALRRARRRRRRSRDRGRGTGARPRRAHGAPRRRAGAPDADRVRPAAGARAQPRTADDPPRAAHRGVGPGVRRRRAGAAHAHRASAREDRAARAAGGRATSSPTRVSGYRFVRLPERPRGVPSRNRYTGGRDSSRGRDGARP